MKANYLLILLISGLSMGICVAVIAYYLFYLHFEIKNLTRGEFVKEKYLKKSIMLIAISSGIFTASLVLFTELIKVARWM